MNNITFYRFISNGNGYYEIGLKYNSKGHVYEIRTTFPANQPLFLIASLLKQENVLNWLLEHCRLLYNVVGSNSYPEWDSVKKIEIPEFGIWEISKEDKKYLIFTQGEKKLKIDKLEAVKGHPGCFLNTVKIRSISISRQKMKELNFSEEIILIKKIVDNFQEFPLFMNKNQLNEKRKFSRLGFFIDSESELDYILPLIKSRLAQVKIEFGPDKYENAGYSFASDCLMSLCWAELYFCAVQGLKINKCKHCGIYFTNKRDRKVCSRACTKAASAENEGLERKLKKAEHEELTKLMAKVKKGEISSNVYRQEWEKTRYSTKPGKKVAWNIHPFRAVLLEGPVNILQMARDIYNETGNMESIIKLLARNGLSEWPSSIATPLSKEILKGRNEYKQKELKTAIEIVLQK